MASNESSGSLVVGLIVVVMIVSMVSVVSLTYAFTHTSAPTGVTVTQTEVAVETETSTQTQTQILQAQGNSYPTRPSRPSSGQPRQPPTSTMQASEYGLVTSNGWMQTQNGCQIQLINMPSGYAGQYVTVYGTITYTNTNTCPTNIIVSSVT
jgi:hypothetical protein